MSGDDEKLPPAAGGERTSRAHRTVAEGEDPPPPPPLAVATGRDDSKKGESRASQDHVDLDASDGEDSPTDNGDEDVVGRDSVAESSAAANDEEEEDPADTVNDSDDDDDDDDEDTEEDDEEELDEAVEQLRELNGNPQENRVVFFNANLGRVPAMVGDPRRQQRYRRAFPGHFRDFVTELGRGAHDVISLELRYANFCEEGWNAPEGREHPGGGSRGDADDDEEDDAFRVDVDLQPDERDLEQMFGTVLPSLACLMRISFKNSRLQPRFLNSFAEAATRNPTFVLGSLAIVATSLDAECARILKCMLQGDVRLRFLYLQRCGLDAEGWRLVCEGAAANRHLKHLDLKDEVEVATGTVVAALGAESTLSELHLAPRRWSHRAFGELVEALRVNTALSKVFLSQKGGFKPAQADLVLDLLRTYNFTLLGLRLVPRKDGTRSYEVPIGELLRRNSGLRRTVAHLGARDYRVPRRAARPLALHQFNTIPTLLYRLVRRGNVDSLAEQAAMGVASASTPPNERKRSHDQLQQSSSDA